MEALKKLYEHQCWADERALEALERAGHPSAASALFAHVLGAEEVWLARLEGRAPRAAVWPTLAGAELARLASAVRAGYARYQDSLDASAAERLVRYVNSAGQAFESRVEDILLHVALHGAYHRGQVMQLLREGGAEASPTDYIAFVRGAPAAKRVEPG